MYIGIFVIYDANYNIINFDYISSNYRLYQSADIIWIRHVTF
jgi:hypothetical protein